MGSCFRCFLAGVVLVLSTMPLGAQSPSSKSPPVAREQSTRSGLDPGTVTGGIYRNRSLSLTVKIPPGWVLRTAEMNERDDASPDAAAENPQSTQNQGEVEPRGNQGSPSRTPGSTGQSRSGAPTPDSRAGCPSGCSRVLLAAFSRPPEAKGEDVNGSILIAAESVSMYPGLTEAAQYFGPLTEVAKAQGFTVDEEPYEFALGDKNLVRGDFHKDVGTRVMRQSTLALLSHGYAISITVIGGTEDEVEELMDGVIFRAK